MVLYAGLVSSHIAYLRAILGIFSKRPLESARLSDCSHNHSSVPTDATYPLNHSIDGCVLFLYYSLNLPRSPCTTMSCRSRLRKRFAKQEARSKAVAAAMLQNSSTQQRQPPTSLLSRSTSDGHGRDGRDAPGPSRLHSCEGNASTSTLCSRNSSTMSLSSSSLSSQPSVTFGSIEVREYDRSLVDCLHDVPKGLALGWDYHQRPPVAIVDDNDDFTDDPHNNNVEEEEIGKSNATGPSREKERALPAIFQRVLRGGRQHQKVSSMPSRAGRGAARTMKGKGTGSYDRQPTTLLQRVEILQQFGYTEEELACAESERLKQVDQRLPSCVAY